MLNYQSDQRMMLTRTPINTLGGEFFFSIGSSPLFSINTPLPPLYHPSGILSFDTSLQQESPAKGVILGRGFILSRARSGNYNQVNQGAEAY